MKRIVASLRNLPLNRGTSTKDTTPHRGSEASSSSSIATSLSRLSARTTPNVSRPLSPLPTERPLSPRRKVPNNTNEVSRLKQRLHRLLTHLNDLEKLTGGLNAFGQRLQTECTQLLNFEAKETTTIALMGDTGCGKSSLVNALIGKGHNLAVSAAAGSACTAFPIEFKSSDFFAPTCERRSESPPKYAATIHYLTPDEWVIDFRQIVKKLKQCGESEASSKVGDDALKRLRLVFPNLTKDKLISMLEWGDEMILEETKQSVKHQLPWPQLEETIEHDYRESFVEEFQLRIKMPEKVVNDCARLLPIIKKVVVYITDSELLDGGVILVDLPGLHETDSRRMSYATEYSSYCDEVFAIADVMRAANNRTVWDVLGQGALRQQLRLNGKIILSMICTKTDSFTRESADNDFEENKREVTRLKEAEKQAKRDRKNLEIQLKKEGDSWPKERRKELKKALKKAAEAEIDADRQIKLLYYNTRNKTIRERICVEQSSNLSVNVFCVTSISYQALHEYVEDKTFLTDETETGIPQLVAHSLKLPKQRRQAQIENFKLEFHKLFSEAETWLAADELANGLDQKTLAGVRETMELILSDLESKLGTMVSSFEKDLRQEFKHIYDAAARAVPQAQNSALEISRTWERLFWNTYKATCAGNGFFIDTKRVTHDWNYDLSKGIVQRFENEWIQTFDGRNGTGGGVETAIGKMTTQLKNHFEKLPNLFKSRIYNLKSTSTTITLPKYSEEQPLLPKMRLALALGDRSVEVRERKINHLAKSILVAVQKTQRSANYAVLFSDKAVIRQRMIPAYEECAEQSGPGMYARMRGIMYDYISGRHSPLQEAFVHLPKALENELDGIVCLARDRVQEELDKVMLELRQATEQVFRDSETWTFLQDSERVQGESLKAKAFVEQVLFRLEQGFFNESE